MADRSRRIAESIEQAENDRAQAKALLADYEARLNSAKAEADTIIRGAREKARQEADLIAAEGKTAADNALRNAQKQIEAERHAALASFRKEAASLVIAASGRILGREIKSEDNLQYAQMLLQETSALGSGDAGLDTPNFGAQGSGKNR